MNNAKSLPEWQATISHWAGVTFNHTEVGIVKHILREAVELAYAVGMTEYEVLRATNIALELGRKKDPKTPDEQVADLLILELTLAGYLRFDAEDALVSKHVVNLHRQWGKPDSEGIVEHVAEVRP